MLNLDFETRSSIDLTKVGADKYAQHGSTSVLCASFTINNSAPMQWRRWQNQQMPIALQKALYDDDVQIHAWNAAFERLILKHVLKIDLDPSRFRCTMARARSMALPGKLGLCARALHMPTQKGSDKIMRKWCKPLVKGGWADDSEEYEQLCTYCDLDVLTEKGIGAILRELTPPEQRDWEITEKINDNGIPIDLALVRAAQHYAGDELLEIKARLSELTRGLVTSPRQFERLKDWLPPELELTSLDAAARAELLENEDIQGDIREVIQLVDDGGRASTAKFAAMEARADSNDRVHGAYIFNGAGQTGRFCVSGETRVDTVVGCKRIDSLQQGDLVLTHRGRFRPVMNLFYKGREEMYRLTFKGGASIICTAGHRILTTDGWRHVGKQEISEGKLQNNLRALCPAPFQDTVADCRGVWYDPPDYSGGVANGVDQDTKDSPQTRELLAFQAGELKPTFRHGTRKETGVAARVRSRVERQRVHATTPQIDGRRIGLGMLAVEFSNSSYRRQQDEQRDGQFRFGDDSWTSILTSRAFEKVEAVGVRGVWDIEVEEDHSYVAQGLIHHNSSNGAQLHNYIRKKLDNTEDVIDAILKRVPKKDLIDLSGYNVLTTLSRLLRPSLVAENGKEFVWGDWKSIEARVLPWLSLENSAAQLLELFANGTDIYEHQASMMFGSEKVTKDQRQAGKVAILSCFGQHTRILTNNGVKAIVEVTVADKLWDGERWVAHSGVISRGVKSTVMVAGIDVTPEHLFLVARKWKWAEQLASSQNILHRALATGSANLPWSVTSTAQQEVSHLSKFNVRAALNPTASTDTIYERALQLVATRAPKSNLITGVKIILATQISWLTQTIVDVCSVVFPRVLTGATIQMTPPTQITAGEGFTFLSRGVPIEKLFSHIWSRLRVGISQNLNSIEWMSTRGMRPATSNSPLDDKMFLTDVQFNRCNNVSSNLKPVFDILNAGPRNRFTVVSDDGFLIAHNCGFGGGAGAFLAMAKNYDMDVDEATAEMYKKAWRRTNPWAERFWRKLENAAFNALREQGKPFTAGRVAYMSTGSVLWCLLPSGRMLAYPFPEAKTVEGRFGTEHRISCIKGSWAPRKDMNYWPRMNLWGGILAENITQGEAASLLRWALRELDDAGWIACMIGHTHDEVLLEVPDAEIADASAALKDIMESGPDWAAGLPLAADVEHGAVYGK